MTLNRDPEKHEVTKLRELVDITDKRVLEIGCGAGQLLWQYTDAPSLLIGIDSEFSAISSAPNQRPQHTTTSPTFACAKGETLPFRDHSFDVVVFSSSL